MKLLVLTALVAGAVGGSTMAQDATPHALTPIPIQDVTVEDAFWSPKIETWRTVTIPDSFTKFERDGALRNFDRVRDGKSGEHGGPPWYDGLIYEMIRAASDFLAAHPDPNLDQRLDGYINRIAAAAAKDPDGYLNTHTQLMEPNHRWGLNGGNTIMQHEVYNAGALVEAGVHHFLATGKTRLLSVAVRFANHMCDLMGPPPRKNIIPEHEISTEAVVKLYRLFREHPDLKQKLSIPVDEHRYLKLAEFWIETRGNHEGRPSLGPYSQDHMPVLRQETIEGHAVRATLMCTGLSATAMANGRSDYYRAATRLWENMTSRRMHITGGTGAFADEEKFGPDWVLPNSAYLETCAAVGAGFFHHNMNLAIGEARYADELERVLYNGVLSGVSLKGDTYFYENPLVAPKTRARWAWHGCPCCPPMFLKIVGALPGYVYARDKDGVCVNLFIGSRARVTLGGNTVGITQTTRYPWEGNLRIAVEPQQPAEFNVNVRIPAWCPGATLKVAGKPVENLQKLRGYARIRRLWKQGDTIEIDVPLPVRRIKAHPRVEADLGRAALMRGPMVYCLEGCDHQGRTHNLSIPPDAAMASAFRPDLLGGVAVITGNAIATHRSDWGRSLYLPASELPGRSSVPFTAVPYYANANRGPAELDVWIPETPDLTQPAPLPTIASEAIPSASHCFPTDTVLGLNDQIEPKASDDTSIPRFTWWDHRGTREWVQYDFDKARAVASVEVYWWDERRIKAHCRVPQSWRLLYKDGNLWKPVTGASEFGVKMDCYNKVTFDPVTTTALRIEVQLQPEWSGGIPEWRVAGP